jgi:DNA repair exonuclease SbcCD ATPase subunit
MPRKKKESVEIQETVSQVELFSYGDLSEEVAKLAKESAIEIKAREKAIWENIIEIGNRLIEVKNALPHGSFESWVKQEFKWDRSTSAKYIKIAEEIKANVDYNLHLPSSVNALYQLASGLSKADDEGKEEIMSAVEARTEEKGKALTEKEIKEITKEFEEKIKQLEQEKEQLSLTLESSEENFNDALSHYKYLAENKERELAESKTTLENQHKQIQELHSEISQSEYALRTINAERAEVDLLRQEIEERIEKEANIIASKTLEKERLRIEKKEKELEAKAKQLQSEIKAVVKTKDNLNHVDDWITTLEQFNQSFNEQIQYLVSTFRKLQDLPKLEELESDDLAVANQKIYDVIRVFHDNSDAFGRALTNLHGALRKVDRTILKTIDVEGVE